MKGTSSLPASFVQEVIHLLDVDLGTSWSSDMLFWDYFVLGQ